MSDDLLDKSSLSSFAKRAKFAFAKRYPSRFAFAKRNVDEVVLMIIFSMAVNLHY
ncbi:unnamed protein product [Gongylonema pulchrum]|uniref:Ion_trans domain-containing protein n=1 Tax=Gongylonema pulchrum TaxID=637853 RepID=A0A183CVW4_9BILA|nr:unnamed protein product [Gongylonema pulchrum]